MANFHLRDLPEPLYAKLEKRAHKAGRSINRELIHILEAELARPTPEDLVAELHRLQRESRLPPDAPAPEDLIRWDRDHGH